MPRPVPDCVRTGYARGPMTLKNLPKEAFGNAAGWATAAAIFVVCGALLMTLANAGAATATTALGRDSANYGPIEMPLDLAELLPTLPADQPDAASLYRDAADELADDSSLLRQYERFAESAARPASDGDLPLLQTLVDAAATRPTAIFADEPATLVNYDRSLPRLEALYAVGNAAARQAGLLAARDEPGDAERARELYQAALALGAQLYRERVVHREMEFGYRLVGQSLGGLAALAQKSGDAARAAELRTAREAFSGYVNGRLSPVWDAISAINDYERDDDLADVHAGDVAAIAASESADPMWRVEATLRLGKLRHDASRRGDALAAERLIERLREEADEPRLSLAADAASELTATGLLNAR